MAYITPAGVRIGHIHLKVTNLERALGFYRDLLGFEVQQYYGDSAVFISAGGYHHHIGLNTWYSKDGSPAPLNTAGLYHTAILYPERKDLAIILKRLIEAKYPIAGAIFASMSGSGSTVYALFPKDKELRLNYPPGYFIKELNGQFQ